MSERIRDFYMVGRQFQTDGTVDDLNRQLAEVGLVVDVYSPDDRPTYVVERLSGLTKSTKYQLIHDNPGYGRNEGKHSLGRVIIGELVSHGSAVRSDFYTSSQSGKTLVDYISRVKRDFPNPDVIIVEQKEG